MVAETDEKKTQKKDEKSYESGYAYAVSFLSRTTIAALRPSAVPPSLQYTGVSATRPLTGTRISSLTKKMAKMPSVYFGLEPKSKKSFLALLKRLEGSYGPLVYSQFEKSLPVLYAEAGRNAKAMGVPWEILGQFAIPMIYPTTVTMAKKARITGIGFMRMTEIQRQARGALFIGPSGQKKASWTGWAIPQPTISGVNPSPWFSGTNWHGNPRPGALYPSSRWLWREELGLMGTKSAPLVLEALASAGLTAGMLSWNAPPYSTSRLAGMSYSPGINVGMHWVPPTLLHDAKGRFTPLVPGPGIPPKYFMRIATTNVGVRTVFNIKIKLRSFWNKMSAEQRQRLGTTVKVATAGMRLAT